MKSGQWESLGLEVEPLQHTASADNIGDLATKGRTSTRVAGLDDADYLVEGGLS